MEFIINRFEGGFAVCESKSGSIFNIPAEIFEHAKEGDVVRLFIDKAETEKRKNACKASLGALFGGQTQKGQ